MPNIAASAVEMVQILTAKTGAKGSLGHTLSKASPWELFTWWHEAIAHECTAMHQWEKALASALGAEIARECVARCGREALRKSRST